VGPNGQESEQMWLGKFNPNNAFLRVGLCENVKDHNVLQFQYDVAIEEESTG
jgi:hypothetical protein